MRQRFFTKIDCPICLENIPKRQMHVECMVCYNKFHIQCEKNDRLYNNRFYPQCAICRQKCKIVYMSEKIF